MLEREAAWLPPWRRLVRVLQRLEARGEVRGGRFIAGLSGEQFALPDAVAQLRKVRRNDGDGPVQWVCVGACDPANLAGTVLAGQRVARVPGNRVVYRDGVAVAVHTGNGLEWLQPEAGIEVDVVTALLRATPDRRVRANSAV